MGMSSFFVFLSLSTLTVSSGWFIVKTMYLESEVMLISDAKGKDARTFACLS